MHRTADQSTRTAIALRLLYCMAPAHVKNTNPGIHRNMCIMQQPTVKTAVHQECSMQVYVFARNTNADNTVYKLRAGGINQLQANDCMPNRNIGPPALSKANQMWPRENVSKR